MPTFLDYQRTRARQALGILLMVVAPTAAITLALCIAGHWGAVLLPGFPLVVALYAAWDLQRVTVDPDTMTVVSIPAAVRGRQFRWAVLWGCIASAVLLAFAVAIEAPGLMWIGIAIAYAIAAQGVHLFVTDTRIVQGSVHAPALTDRASNALDTRTIQLIDGPEERA